MQYYVANYKLILRNLDPYCSVAIITALVIGAAQYSFNLLRSLHFVAIGVCMW